MTISIGTDTGLFTVGEQRLEPRWTGAAVIGQSGDWVLTADGRLLDTINRTETPVIGDDRALCLASTPDGTVLVGTAGAHVLRLGPAGLEPLASFDAIDGREKWYTPWGAPPDTRSLAVADDGTVFVNVHVGGVWRGAADGTWEPVVEVDDDTHQVVASDGWVAVAAAVGAGVSDDGGATFRWSAAGLHASYCRAAAVAGDTLLVTASTGPFTHQGAVYRRPLGSDEPFVRCRDGHPDWFPSNIDTFQLAARGTDVALASPDGDVYTSADAGRTWRRLASGVGPISCIAVI